MSQALGASPEAQANAHKLSSEFLDRLEMALKPRTTRPHRQAVAPHFDMEAYAESLGVPAASKVTEPAVVEVDLKVQRVDWPAQKAQWCASCGAVHLPGEACS